MLSILTKAAAPFPAIVLPRYIIDVLVSGENYGKVLFYSCLMFAANFLLTNLNRYMSEAKNVMALRLNNELALNVKRKCLDMDYEMFNNTAMQERAILAQSLSSNNNFVSLLDGISTLISSSIILVGVVVLVMQFDRILIVCAVIVVALQCLLYYFHFQKGMQIEEDSSIANRCIRFMEPLFMKAKIKKDIEIYHMSEFLIHKYRAFVENWMEVLVRRSKLNNAYGLFNSMLSFVYQLFTYILLGFKVISKEITVGSFTMGINSLNNFMSASNSIVHVVIDVRVKLTFINKYDTFLKIPNKSTRQKQSVAVSGSELDEIVFENVSFKYPGSTSYILKNINLKIKKGEKIALVGMNGAGKTTIILLLTRMYFPTDGRILFNGVDIKEIDRDSYRDLFSVVHQDFLMLPFSIRENIDFHTQAEGVQEQKIKRLLEECGLKERIDCMYQGIDTPISKEIDARGVDLSGGEVQKIAIVRALYKDASIVILDEPTSALDPVAESEIYQQFDKMTEQKTAVYISHRMISTRFCDRIIVLNHGEIAEEGTFDALNEKQGLYYKFYQMQAQYFQNDYVNAMGPE